VNTLNEKLITFPQEALEQVQTHVHKIYDDYRNREVNHKTINIAMYSKDFQLNLKGTQYAFVGTIPISLTFTRELDGAKAYTSSDGNQINIEINLNKINASNINWVVEHELIHAFQIQLSVMKNSDKVIGGLPKKKIQSDDIYDEALPHEQRDIEYHPNLVVYVRNIENLIKNNPKITLKDAFEYLLGKSPQERNKLIPLVDNLFRVKKSLDILKQEDPKRWEYTIKDIYKALT